MFVYYHFIVKVPGQCHNISFVQKKGKKKKQLGEELLVRGLCYPNLFTREVSLFSQILKDLISEMRKNTQYCIDDVVQWI